ncbi:hypothetical protein CMO88_03935 [Candidatus Woesearchaeota archaeon]|nr:hypothetical protein [Candidatus Woesearchaeota archaeon]|tara:strand:- start:2894 stop:3163 length:270 start_codon:yes stop_codon:yes gene_type:complete
MVETFYDKNEDVLNIQLKDSDYWKSVELPNGIVVDMSKLCKSSDHDQKPLVVFDIAKDGEIAAIEIIKASKIFVGDLKKVIETAAVAAN